MAEIIHIILPYDLTEDSLISSLEPAPHRDVEESHGWPWRAP